MTKAYIVANIANETGLEKTEVLRAVEAFMGSIKTSLSDGKNVYLRGFGSFIVKRRAQKTGRNISKKQLLLSRHITHHHSSHRKHSLKV